METIKRSRWKGLPQTWSFLLSSRVAPARSSPQIGADFSACLHISTAHLELTIFLFVFYSEVTLMTFRWVCFSQSLSIRLIAADTFFLTRALAHCYNGLDFRFNSLSLSYSVLLYCFSSLYLSLCYPYLRAFLFLSYCLESNFEVKV